MRTPVSSLRSALIIILLGSAFAAGAQRFQSNIQSYLQKEKGRLQLSDNDIANWTVSDQYDNPETGVTYTYLNQQVAGIRIFNAVSSTAIRDGQVIHFANRFHADAAKKANALSPSVSALQALETAASHLGLTMAETPRLQEKEPNRLRYTYTRAGISREEIKAELILLPRAETLLLAWNVIIAPKGSPDWWNIRIDALTGQFIEKNNWTTHCNFGTPHQHSTVCTESARAPFESLTASTKAPNATGNYNVYALPLEAPSFGSPSLQTNPNSTIASPLGWHDTDGVDGAEFTITRGNNVYSYEDIQNFDQPGYSPDGSPALNFNFPFDLEQSTLFNQDAALTNLFYMNNMLHDILYLHGFDEQAGNFQAKNYTGTGSENDYVVAEGQDGGGLDNANFSTPEDGFNGRMQMYMWATEATASMKVLAPDSVAGYYVAVPASFGPSLTTPVTGYTAVVIDAEDPTVNGCDSILNSSALAGKIAILDRGDCPYVEKVKAAEAAGAIAVIVVNTTASAPIVMGGSGVINIPSVMITLDDGNMLKAILAAGDSVQITLGIGPSQRDGSLDNGIIAHEYGHGLSNRLTGGPNNSSCLFNAEQGGEGWSDWLGLILTIEPGDAGPDRRGIGTYATNDASGKGIRRFPYSTDMGINGQTYGDVANSNGVHAVGEIWSQTLWEMTWMLIDAEGFDPDWYNGTGGNNTAMRLVIEGMKLQPCGPGYIDGRDAIIAADQLLYKGAHTCLLWEAFAKRGMGAYALQGSADDTGDETEDFTIPNTCLTATVPPTALFAVNETSNCFGIFNFTDQSTDIPQFYAWDFGDGNVSDRPSPSHTYTVPGAYTVTVIVTNNVGADTFQLNVAYEDLAEPAITGNMAVCEGSYTTLIADVVDGNTAIWSEGTNVVYTGTAFQTPALSAPVTYTVMQSEDKPVYNVGPATNNFGGGGNHNTGFEGKLLFETFAPVRIISVRMYAEGDGNRTIRLYDQSNQVIDIATVFLTDGENRVTLNFDIPVIGRYSIANVSENVYRNNAGASYPYDVDNLLSIYSSNATNDELNFYYYFYDWIVQEALCQSQAVEVTVEVTPGPVAGFLADAVNLAATFTDISSGDPMAWSWNFGDGSPVSTEQNPMHTFPAEGVYTVELTVTNGTCFSVYQQTLEVGNISATNENMDAFGLSLFPNPASDEVQLEIRQAYNNTMQLLVTNATGRTILSRPLQAGVGRFSINTSSLSAGTYQFQVIGDTGVSVRRVTIVR